MNDLATDFGLESVKGAHSVDRIPCLRVPTARTVPPSSTSATEAMALRTVVTCDCLPIRLETISLSSRRATRRLLPTNGERMFCSPHCRVCQAAVTIGTIGIGTVHFPLMRRWRSSSPRCTKMDSATILLSGVCTELAYARVLSPTKSLLCCFPEWEYEKDLAVRTGRSLMTGD